MGREFSLSARGTSLHGDCICRSNQSDSARTKLTDQACHGRTVQYQPDRVFGQHPSRTQFDRSRLLEELASSERKHATIQQRAHGTGCALCLVTVRVSPQQSEYIVISNPYLNTSIGLIVNGMSSEEGSSFALNCAACNNTSLP